MMVEYYSFDDVGQGYDLAQLDPEKIAVTLGRHAGDYMTSFYTWNPSAFMVECGWGGRAIDPGAPKQAAAGELMSLYFHFDHYSSGAASRPRISRNCLLLTIISIAVPTV